MQRGDPSSRRYLPFVRSAAKFHRHRHTGREAAIRCACERILGQDIKAGIHTGSHRRPAMTYIAAGELRFASDARGPRLAGRARLKLDEPAPAGLNENNFLMGATCQSI